MMPPRKAGLDLVRSLAILLVLAGHGALLLPPEVIEAQWRVRPLYAGGYFGVELFFVLSGCLVLGLLFRLLEREPQFGWLAALCSCKHGRGISLNSGRFCLDRGVHYTRKLATIFRKQGET